jgi:hypothetical protein
MAHLDNELRAIEATYDTDITQPSRDDIEATFSTIRELLSLDALGRGGRHTGTYQEREANRAGTRSLYLLRSLDAPHEVMRYVESADDSRHKVDFTLSRNDVQGDGAVSRDTSYRLEYMMKEGDERYSEERALEDVLREDNRILRNAAYNSLEMIAGIIPLPEDFHDYDNNA